MLNILLSGACGRMGREIAHIACEHDVKIVSGVDVNVSDMPFPVYPSFDLCALHDAQVLVDFTRAENLPFVLDFAVKNKLPLLLAATGYGEKDLSMIRDAAKVIPIFRSANLSLGVHVLKLLSKKAAELLPGFDIEIVEKHHNQKLDAPSGTANMLYDAVKNAQSVPVYGRHDRTQRRDKNEIGLLSVRGGTVTGEHEVGFYGQEETVLISHSAQNRRIFAHGAMRACRFICDQAPGEYNMDDMIAL
ncbi:MAG: 4-hydroxy-tetrahydrodipicolinate reductase [Clostridiales bacterium]|nr:4-hydroxy-tetrahydrodipicolinate reductase [Clostridiales bacterium]